MSRTSDITWGIAHDLAHGIPAHRGPETIEAFCRRNKLEISSEPTPGNPHMSDMPKGSRHFQVTITQRHHDRPPLVTSYSVGPGIIEQFAVENMRKKAHTRTLRRGTIDWQKALETYGNANAYRPELPDVLNCLRSDASSYTNALDFEDWCSNLGYDSDSRRALAAFEACGKTRADLVRLLGHKEAEQLMFNVEPL